MIEIKVGNKVIRKRHLIHTRSMMMSGDNECYRLIDDFFTGE